MDYITSSVALRNVGLGTLLSPRLVVVRVLYVSSVRAITSGVKEECTNSQMHAHFLGNPPGASSRSSSLRTLLNLTVKFRCA